MVVTVADLAIELRLPDTLDAQQTSVLTRLIGVGEAFVDLLISGAPLPIQEEVIIRLGAYLYEQPTSGRRDSYSNSWVNSGAGALASRWLTQTIAGDAGIVTTTPGGGGGTGQDGDPGEKGDQGERGDQGNMGTVGDTGEKGDDGDPGEKGDQGERGDQGNMGTVGDTGEKGDTGETGEQGIQGERGEKGDTGDTGETGPIGPAGTATSSTAAYRCGVLLADLPADRTGDQVSSLTAPVSDLHFTDFRYNIGGFVRQAPAAGGQRIAVPAAGTYRVPRNGQRRHPVRERR